MHKALKLLRWLTALGTVVILLLLAWQCIDIYLNGSFRMEDVAQRLMQLTVPMGIYTMLLLMTGGLHLVFGRGKVEDRAAPVDRFPCKSKSEKDVAASEKHAALIRWVLCGLAVLFIGLGVMNGGWYDVLVKAINICSECIGLG